jgi:hypothetical protein
MNTSTFWIAFCITMVVSAAQAEVSQSNIKPGLKAALENLIAAGQQVTVAIQTGQ